MSRGHQLVFAIKMAKIRRAERDKQKQRLRELYSFSRSDPHLPLSLIPHKNQKQNHNHRIVLTVKTYTRLLALIDLFPNQSLCFHNDHCGEKKENPPTSTTTQPQPHPPSLSTPYFIYMINRRLAYMEYSQSADAVQFTPNNPPPEKKKMMITSTNEDMDYSVDLLGWTFHDHKDDILAIIFDVMAELGWTILFQPEEEEPPHNKRNLFLSSWWSKTDMIVFTKR